MKMTYGGVFWYGVVISVLSFIAGAAPVFAEETEEPLAYALAFSFPAGLMVVAVNWVVFVLPVVLMRNARVKGKARQAETTELDALRARIAVIEGREGA